MKFKINIEVDSKRRKCPYKEKNRMVHSQRSPLIIHLQQLLLILLPYILVAIAPDGVLVCKRIAEEMRTVTATFRSPSDHARRHTFSVHRPSEVGKEINKSSGQVEFSQL